jgi:hypothetical protein
MQRTTSPDAVSSLPTPLTTTNPPGYYNQTTNPVLGTTLSADAMNSLQEEICNVIAAAGISLNVFAENQLLLSINDLIDTKAVAYVPLTHMGLAGSGFNSGNPNGTATASFTPAFNGILVVNGVAAQASGTFTTSDLSAPATTTLGGYGNTSAGATSNIASSGFTAIVTAGTPVTITFAMTGTGTFTANTNIGFTYFVLPTS